MSQHDSLRERTEQHKPKNSKSKIDDKEVYQAMELVKQYLKSKKTFNHTLKMIGIWNFLQKSKSNI